MKFHVCQVVPSSAHGVQNRLEGKAEEGEITKSKDLVSDNRMIGIGCDVVS